MTIKCDTINALTTKIKQMEHSLSHQKHTTNDNVLAENTSIAIYGLRTNNDIITTVNHLFDGLNLRHINFISAYRTPARPNIKQNGVVIAQLSSLNDKREVLDRKRYLRNMAQYRNVFLKSSKSHAEQVMNANFNLVLNEMSNGDAYFISDNGRIIQKNRNILNVYSMYHIVLVVLTSLLVTVMGEPDQRTHITIAVPGIKVLTLGSTNIALAVVLAKALFQIMLEEPRIYPEDQTNHHQHYTLITTITTICKKITPMQIRIHSNTIDILFIHSTTKG